MDFGDIMKDWDKASRARAVKKAKPAKGKPVDVVRNAQESWLDAYGVPDAAERERLAEDRRFPSRKEMEAMPVDAVLDLHGMTALEAEDALAGFFRDAAAKNCRKVLIIHGKGLHSSGGAVLGRVAARWLERCAAAGRSGRAERSQGGGGATWVLVRGGNQRSR